MYSEEQRVIESLFTRLKQAENQSGPRDAAAAELIKAHIHQQPEAPYYMAQALIIQEAAMKQLNQRVSELENQLRQTRQPLAKPSGSFLSGLFGGGQRNTQPAQPAYHTPPASPWNNAAPSQAARGTGFLGGALQTAVGVAGGVVMADMLTSMFHHSPPEEIVNIINEPTQPTDMTLTDNADTSFLQDANWQPDNVNDLNDFNGVDDNGFGGDDFNDDNFI